MKWVLVPNMHCEVLFASSVVCPYPVHPSFFQLIYQWLHVHTYILPWILGSCNYQWQEHVLALHYGVGGGEVEGNNKHGQTTICLWHHTKQIQPIESDGNSCILCLFCFLMMYSIETLPCLGTRRMYQHWSPMIIFVASYPIFVPCHLFGCIFVQVKTLNSWQDWKYRRTFAGTLLCFFVPSLRSLSTYLEALHLAQYVSSSYSFVNKTHPFGQACICS